MNNQIMKTQEMNNQIMKKVHLLKFQPTDSINLLFKTPKIKFLDVKKDIGVPGRLEDLGFRLQL